jgi:uncharacterized repeat protein (TIGR03803 family)
MKFKIPALAMALLAMASGNLPAQTVTLLHDFTNNPDGANPFAGLALAGGTLYGATVHGGTNSAGTVFSVNTDGSSYRLLHVFAGPPDGSAPQAGLVLAGGTLYGAASGGTNAYGCLFSVGTNGGGYKEFYSFNVYSNGTFPGARLVLDGGTLYGTAASDGYGNPGWGTVFSVQTNGSNYKDLYDFSPPHGSPLTNYDGEQPGSGVILARGSLYGAAYGGGTNGYGTIYSVPTNGGSLNVLHTFTNNPDGAYPQGGLIFAGGTLFGTTISGGTNGKGTLFAVNADGSGYLVLHSFLTNGMDGLNPEASLTLVGGTLFGTTRLGGAGGRGTVFSIQTQGANYSVLYDFTNTLDGADPESQLLYSAGSLYGAAEAGGSSIWGTVFRLNLPVLAITGLSVAGTNLVITATNGIAGEFYEVLASSNMSVPPRLWLPVATNILTDGGNFTITVTNAVSPTASQQFYLLQTQ